MRLEAMKADAEKITNSDGSKVFAGDAHALLMAFYKNEGADQALTPIGDGWAKGLRVEVPSGSLLPARLIEYGYNPRHCGIGTRLTSGSTPENIFRNVDIIEISLGK
jgi:hypothetical protein